MLKRLSYSSSETRCSSGMAEILAAIAREISSSEISANRQRGQGFFPCNAPSAFQRYLNDRAGGQCNGCLAVFNLYVKRLYCHAPGIFKIIVRVNLAA